MAKSTFNTGIVGPSKAPYTVETPLITTESNTTYAPLDWTLQENNVFAAVAGDLVGAIQQWKALDAKAAELETAKVEADYKNTLAQWEPQIAFDTDPDVYKAKYSSPFAPEKRRPNPELDVRQLVPITDAELPDNDPPVVDDNNQHVHPNYVHPNSSRATGLPVKNPNFVYVDEQVFRSQMPEWYRTPSDFEEADESFGKVKYVPVPRRPHNEQTRKEHWDTHVGYANSNKHVLNVSKQNEELKQQAYHEAKIAGASEKELRELLKNWYEPGGGLSKVVYSDFYGFTPAKWETQ
jgi:hypothetical protein